METHLFRRDEPAELLASNGVPVSTVIGLEGSGSPFHDEAFRRRIDPLPEGERAALVRTLDRLRDDPAVADLSVHLLAVGRA